MKTRNFLLLLMIAVLLSACAHPSGGGATGAVSLRIESPYYPAEISINGEKIGVAPLTIPFSRLSKRVLQVTAVSTEDPAYRQELTFQVPPLPQKIVVLALHSGTGDRVLSEATGQAANGDKILVAKEKECSADPIFTPTIFFDTDKSDISSQGMEALRIFCQKMQSNPYAMEIVGFADERHTVAYNLKLSLRRAEAVREALQACGLSADRLHVEGRGEIQTLDAGGHKMAWQHNRRVEIRIVQ